MPVTTRNEADVQGMQDEDMVSLDDPPQQRIEAVDGKPAQFDDDQEYHPLFCISDNIPGEYFTCLQSHTQEFHPWLEITTSDPYSESILKQSKADFARTPRMRHSPPPFLDWTYPKLYHFHRDLLRPIRGTRGFGSQFAHFTFLTVDAACVQSPNKDDWQIILCSTAADYGESVGSKPRLKVFRLPIPEAMGLALGTIETLTSTPKEFGKQAHMHANVSPPPMLAPGPLSMVDFKRQAIAGLPEPEGPGEVEIYDV